MSWKGSAKVNSPFGPDLTDRPARGPSTTSTRTPGMCLSALSTTVPLTPALMDGAGCGGGCEGVCGTADGATGVDIESEPPQPINPRASAKSTIPARVLLVI